MSVVPSPWPVAHIVRTFDMATEDDHGNHPRIDGDPVVRKVMSITQYGRRGTSHEIISQEYAQRTETTIAMTVADTTVYHPDDKVLLWPTLDSSGNYVSGSGIAYWVDGDPSDERQGPWPGLLAMFGGIVKLRRVT